MAHTGIFRPLARVGQRLYVRIWLAVVLAVAVLTLLLGWAWRMAAEPPLQEIVVRNTAGEVIGSGVRRPRRTASPSTCTCRARRATAGTAHRLDSSGRWASWPWPWRWPPTRSSAN